MVGLAETQFDLKFRLLGVPVRDPSVLLGGLGGHGLAGERHSAGAAVGRLCASSRFWCTSLGTP